MKPNSKNKTACLASGRAGRGRRRLCWIRSDVMKNGPPIHAIKQSIENQPNFGIEKIKCTYTWLESRDISSWFLIWSGYQLHAFSPTKFNTVLLGSPLSSYKRVGNELPRSKVKWLMWYRIPAMANGNLSKISNT